MKKGRWGRRAASVTSGRYTNMDFTALTVYNMLHMLTWCKRGIFEISLYIIRWMPLYVILVVTDQCRWPLQLDIYPETSINKSKMIFRTTKNVMTSSDYATGTQVLHPVWCIIVVSQSIVYFRFNDSFTSEDSCWCVSYLGSLWLTLRRTRWCHSLIAARSITWCYGVSSCACKWIPAASR